MIRTESLRTSRTQRRMADDPARFRVLVDAVRGYAIFMLDGDGRVVTWSTGAERTYGYSTADMLGEPLDLLFTEEDRRRGAPQLAIETARHDGSYETEGWRIRKDGSRFWAHSIIEAIRDAAGAVIGFAKVTHDVSEQHAAEQALADSERRFRLLVNAVIDYAIFMLDPDGIVAAWNPGAERIKGYTAGEIIGRHFSCFYTEEDRRAGLPQRALEAARRDGQYEAEGWRVRKDGTRFWANVVIDTVRDETGQIVGFAKVTRDLTERRDQELKLDQAREALHQAQKMEALGQLTGGVAHDFNNVLAAVMNSIELARRNPGGSEVRRHLDAALKAAQSGASLVQQMLIFARKQPLQTQPVDVNAAVQSVATMLRHSCPENIQIVTALDPGAPWVNADPHQLQTALLNVALNARDAMPEGGILRIATSAEAEPPGVDPDGAPFACISIVDTGVGMKPDVLAHAFEPFFTTKEVGKGTGLGLAMVYGAVRQLGGEVTLESVVGRGTTVRLFLPLAPAPQPRQVERGKVKTDGAPTGLPLLFVEDDAIVNMSATELLAAAGYRVYSAGRAEDALALLDSHPDIRLLVTDIGLPGMNGQELAKEARRRRPNLKVLFVTGYDRTGTMNQQQAEADTLYIVKPYEAGHLCETLERLIAS